MNRFVMAVSMLAKKYSGFEVEGKFAHLLPALFQGHLGEKKSYYCPAYDGYITILPFEGTLSIEGRNHKRLFILVISERKHPYQIDELTKFDLEAFTFDERIKFEIDGGYDRATGGGEEETKASMSRERLPGIVFESIPFRRHKGFISFILNPFETFDRRFKDGRRRKLNKNRRRNKVSC